MEDPMSKVLYGLVEATWNTLGEGSTAIWRQVGERFYETLQEGGRDLSTPEASLESIKEYFQKYDNLGDMSYEIENGEAVVKIEGCAYMSIVEYMESNNIPEEHSCPYFNSSMVALEHATGNMYDWKRDKDAAGKCHAHIKRI
jgi:hypothetical protein